MSQFVDELHVSTNVETGDYPVFKAARVYVRKTDYSGVEIYVDAEGEYTMGVWFGMCESDGSLKVELFAQGEPITYRLDGDRWALCDPATPQNADGGE